MTHIQFLAIATYLLDHRRISAGEQSFLHNLSAWARRAGPRFALSERQQDWFEDIIWHHRDALAEAGLEVPA